MLVTYRGDRLGNFFVHCHNVKYASLERIVITYSDPGTLEDVGSPLCFTERRCLRLDISGSTYLDNDIFLEAMSSWLHIEF